MPGQRSKVKGQHAYTIYWLQCTLNLLPLLSETFDLWPVSVVLWLGGEPVSPVWLVGRDWERLLTHRVWHGDSSWRRPSGVGVLPRLRAPSPGADGSKLAGSNSLYGFTLHLEVLCVYYTCYIKYHVVSRGMSYGLQTKTKRTAEVCVVELQFLSENWWKIPEVISEKWSGRGKPIRE